MTNVNILRLLSKIETLERAREQQADTITRLNRRLASRERVIQALEARLAADPRNEAERVFSGEAQQCLSQG